jgi:molecular chaperone GrpE
MKRHNAHSKEQQAPAEPAVEGEPLVPIEPAPMTPDELKALKERAAKADENWDRLLRTTADFDNYKKRAAREKQDAITYANENLLQKLLPVIENLEMALNAAQAAPTGAAESLQTGVNMINQQLKSALAEGGLEEVDALGKAFDPNLHEAIAQKETADAPEGQVVQQLRKGYRFRGRLLRPASVIIAKQPAA